MGDILLQEVRRVQVGPACQDFTQARRARNWGSEAPGLSVVPTVLLDRAARGETETADVRVTLPLGPAILFSPAPAHIVTLGCPNRLSPLPTAALKTTDSPTA